MERKHDTPFFEEKRSGRGREECFFESTLFDIMAQEKRSRPSALEQQESVNLLLQAFAEGSGSGIWAEAIIVAAGFLLW